MLDLLICIGGLALALWLGYEYEAWKNRNKGWLTLVACYVKK
jgi:hypothetical protein